jgi:3-hydroxymyristoyl/3-hydroxydecanoyl-(acyl carrier protein) dehydratase
MNPEQNEQWHYLVPGDDSHGPKDAIKGIAPRRSLWFSGHFPGNPILPGIAILAMVKEAILRGEREKGRNISVTGVRRIRFRLPAKPDDMLDISYSALPEKEKLTYSFKVSLTGQVMCLGTMLATEATNF